MSVSISKDFFIKTKDMISLTIIQLGFLFSDETNAPTMLPRCPPYPSAQGSCGEDHNECELWVFLMNKLGTQWTAMRFVCDLTDCCHREAALLSLSRGALVLIIHT